MVRYGMAVDLDRCTGCTACVLACKMENNTPEGASWMWVFKHESERFPDVKIDALPRPCMHCDEPPCTYVCPVGARFSHEDGFVLTDFERCIGCRYCEVACPYGVNFFNWKRPEESAYFDFGKEASQLYGTGSVSEATGTDGLPNRNPDHAKKYDGRLVAGGGQFVGVMEKCTFCIHRVKKGLQPSCVQNCPCVALIFGDLDDPESDVSRALSRKKAWRLLEELGTEPKVFYLGGRPPGHDVRMLNTGKRV